MKIEFSFYLTMNWEFEMDNEIKFTLTLTGTCCSTGSGEKLGRNTPDMLFSNTH